GGGGDGGKVEASEEWSCPACTYINSAASRRCDMCETAKPACNNRSAADNVTEGRSPAGRLSAKE
ncbi:unnamed protein product, partial [Sphacelaria rigidula]